MKKLTKARTQLIIHHGFFGTLLLQTSLIERPDIKTMATDGTHIYYNAQFVEGMTHEHTLGVFVHEVLHIILCHHTRRGHRDPKKWNIACDYVINPMVRDAGFTLPQGALFDPRFEGLSAEVVYDMLPDSQDSGVASDPGGCGEVLDAAAPSDKDGLAKAEQDVQIKMRQAAMVARKAGAVPASLERVIEQALAPAVDWREQLHPWIDATAKQDVSWLRPNKRYAYQGIILPSQLSDGISHLVLAIDTSGSINKDALAAFASEITELFDGGMIQQITVLYADTEVQRVDTFTTGDELKIEATGGGGTDFRDTMQWVAENAADAAGLIYFTDLEVSEFGDEPPCPVLWSVWGDQRNFERLAKKAPFGDAIFINEHRS